MKLKGKIRFVEEIEAQIRSSAAFLRYKPNVMDDIKSGLSTRQYVIDTSPALAMVKLIFDYRSGSGEVHIKDDKIWKLAKAVPDLITPMSKLTPYHRHKWTSQEELAKIWADKQGNNAEVKDVV